MKRIFVAQTPAEAGVLVGMLEEAGIEAVVEGEMLTGVRMGIPMDASTLPGIRVRDEDAERALGLIEEHRRRAAVSPPPLPEDEMPERPGLVWFKRFLLAWIGLAILGALVLLVSDPHLLALCLGAAAVGGIAWLLVPSRRARR